MPNENQTYRLRTYAIGDKGVTATRLENDAEFVDDYVEVDEFALLSLLVDIVKFDFAADAPAELKTVVLFKLFKMIVADENFGELVIYPMKALNPNPKWVVKIEAEKKGGVVNA